MLQERVGLALRHAGVAITITSLSDFAAFAIGASTVSPSCWVFFICEEVRAAIYQSYSVSIDVDYLSYQA